MQSPTYPVTVIEVCEECAIRCRELTCSEVLREIKEIKEFKYFRNFDESCVVLSSLVSEPFEQFRIIVWFGVHAQPFCRKIILFIYSIVLKCKSKYSESVDMSNSAAQIKRS